MDTKNIEKMKQGTMESFFGMMRLTLELMHTPAPAFLQFFPLDRSGVNLNSWDSEGFSATLRETQQ